MSQGELLRKAEYSGMGRGPDAPSALTPVSPGVTPMLVIQALWYPHQSQRHTLEPSPHQQRALSWISLAASSSCPGQWQSQLRDAP